MLPTTAQLAPVFTAARPVGISCNVPIATSFHVHDAFMDFTRTIRDDSAVLNVGLEAAMDHFVATGPLGGRLGEAMTGLRTLVLPPLETLLMLPSNR